MLNVRTLLGGFTCLLLVATPQIEQQVRHEVPALLATSGRLTTRIGP
jgi:hypothetical protein